MAGIFPTILTATNLFLDVLTSDPDQRVLQCIRKEADDVFITDHSWKDHTRLAALQCTDSAIKETLRQNPLLFRGMIREVVQKNGFTTLDGHHLPQGTWIGVAMNEIHRDGKFYGNPDSYDGLRFTPKRNVQGNAVPKGSQMTEVSEKVQGLTTASEAFLPWGYGRHAW